MWGFQMLCRLVSHTVGPKESMLFSPRDSRVPRLLLPGKDWREGQGENDLVLARITDWPADSNFARGCIEHYLGHAGQIAGETQGILLENNIDTSDFPEEVGFSQQTWAAVLDHPIWTGVKKHRCLLARICPRNIAAAAAAQLLTPATSSMVNLGPS